MQTAANQHHEMLNTYCVTCHNTRAKMGGLALEGLNLQAAADDAEIWEKALRKLRGHQMPPPGSPQPPQKDVDSFVAWMENTLDTHDAKGPKAGYVPIQRLNRTEYAASVKALVGVDVNAKEVLPQDIQVEGFDNIADALSVSPAFLDQYMTAARHDRAARGGQSQSSRFQREVLRSRPTRILTTLCLRARGAASSSNTISRPTASIASPSTTWRWACTAMPLENESTLVIMIDGKIVFRKPIGGPADQALADRKAGTGRAQIMERFSKIPVQVKAGVHDVVVAFIDRSHVEIDENLAKLQPYGGLTGGAARHRPHAASASTAS